MMSEETSKTNGVGVISILSTGAKTGFQQIYRTNFLPEPTDDDYSPPPFNGPQRRIERLHAFPRFGFTKDLTSLALLGTSTEEVEVITSTPSIIGSGGGGGGGNFVDTSGTTNNLNLTDKLSNNNSSSSSSTNATTTLASIEYIPPTYQTNNITYNKKDASDYIKGIAAVAIMIICLYIIWGGSLLLLRVGRVDCCFRLWCCKKKKRRKSVGGGDSTSGSREEEQLDNNVSCRARVGAGQDDDNNEDYDEEEDDDDEGDINQDCCMITCRESIRAKGGCCTRNVFCGWLAGKPPMVPTKASLRKEQELKKKKLINVSGGMKVVGGGAIESVNTTVKGAVVAGKLLKSSVGTTDGAGEEGDVVVGAAEMAVAAVASDEADNNNDGDVPQDDRADAEEGIATKDSKSNIDDADNVIITDEYLRKRQKATRRTMIVIRIIFLASAVLVIIFSIKLCIDGYNGINGILDSLDRSINYIAEHIDAVKTEVDTYIATNEEMALRKAEWFNRTKSQIDSGFEGDKPWCPLALANDGKIEVNLSLGKFLLRGTLFKLALIDKVDDVTEQAMGVVGGVVDAVGVAKEKVFTVVTFLDDLKNPEGGEIQGILGNVLGLTGLIGGDDVNGTTDANEGNRIKTLANRLTKLVQSLIVEGADIVKDVIPGGGGGDQRALQIQPANTVDGIIETIMEKDGINYTILSLADNFTDVDLIINGYNVTKLFTTDLTVEIDIRTLTQAVNQKLEDSSSFLLDIFRRLQIALETVYQQTRGAQDSLESILPYFNVAVAFVAFLIFLTSFFIVGTILAWTKKQHRLFRCTQDRILLPIFILVGLFVWIFTTVFLTLGVLAGDYCVVSPDIQMNKILEQTLEHLSPIGYKFAYYYFNGCQREFRPILMSVAYEALISVRVGLDQFYELVNSMGEGPLRVACGLASETDVVEGDPVNALSILVNVLRNHLGGAMSTVLVVGKLTLCKSFYPMYAFLAHQMLCTDFINLLGPMFSSLFVISIFSMLMVTMRVAWHELVEDEISDGEGDKLEDSGLGNEAAVEAMDAGVAGNDEVIEAEEEEEEDEPDVGEENVEKVDAGPENRDAVEAEEKEN